MYNSVEEAFTRQSEIFDNYEEHNEILKWMRKATHTHLLKHLQNCNNILEINSGTGIDALFFASLGKRVHCTDISNGMLNKLDKKIKANKLEALITHEQLSFAELDKLSGQLFDYIFSNFGGLNCTANLHDIFKQFNNILRPGGKVTLVIMPPICLWELALAFKFRIKTAFRRLHKEGSNANVEGVEFRTYYHSVSKTIEALGTDYRIIDIQGLASVSPPPYMINFPHKLPRLYKLLINLDNKISRHFPFNRFADHFILTAEYNPHLRNSRA